MDTTEEKAREWRRDIRLIAFDADDTLWDCQSHFDQVEKEYCRILSPWGTDEDVSSALFRTETANMPLLGYGSKAFTLSLIENAVAFSHGQIGAADIDRILHLGFSLLQLPATPLPEVSHTLTRLRHTGRYAMVVFTKGELLDQENKLQRSGLGEWFDDVVVVSDKTPAEYVKLCRRFHVPLQQLLMVGNSFKSDIEPVLKLGGYAAYIPFHTIWKHEQTAEYSHPRLTRLTHFGALADVL